MTKWTARRLPSGYAQHDPGKPCATAGHGPLQHLQVAVGVTEGKDGAAVDEAVDADRLAGPLVDELDLGFFISTGLPSALVLNFTTPEEPTTCSGGMP